MAVVAACMGVGTAQAQQAWTLRQCVDYAIAHNISVKQMQNTRELQALQLNTDKNSRLPDLNGSATQNFSFGRGLTAQNTYENKSTSSTSFTIGSTVSLFDGFRTRNTIKLSQLNLDAADADLDKARNDLSMNVAKAYIEAGLDSVYYASLGGEYEFFTDEEFAKWIKPFDIQVMKAIKEAGGYCFLHICKDHLNMERYRDYAPYADVVNWGVFEAPFDLEKGKELFQGKTIMGGLPNRHGVLVDGTKEEVEAEVKKVIREYGRKGLILGADCTLATEQDLDKVKAAVLAARNS